MCRRTAILLSLLSLPLLACGPLSWLRADAPPSGPLLWSADHETGDGSQWRIGAGGYTPEQDSGRCLRGPNGGVSADVAHSGRYALKLTITTPSTPTSGCRNHRNVEAGTGQPAYYSAWFFIPQHARPLDGMWNIFQFKSKDLGMPARSADQAAIWTININARPNGRLYLVLKWHGDQERTPGPTARDGVGYQKFEQSAADVPVGQWFNIKAFLRQSHDFDGQLIVWQDGIELFNMRGIRTNIPGGSQRWAVNNYSNGLSPSTVTLYVDDAEIRSAYAAEGQPISLEDVLPGACRSAAEYAYAAMQRKPLYSQGGNLPGDPVDPRTGKPYPRTGPNSYDCSGLTRAAYLQSKVDIGWVVAEQMVRGHRTNCTIADLDGPNTRCWAPGDLLVLAGLPGCTTRGCHVAIYIRAGIFAECRNHAENCVLGPVEHIPLYRQYFWGGVRFDATCAAPRRTP